MIWPLSLQPSFITTGPLPFCSTTLSTVRKKYLKPIYGGILHSESFPIILHTFPHTCNSIMQSSHVYTQQWLSIKAAYPTPLSTQDTNADAYSNHSHKTLNVQHCNTENFWNVPSVQNSLKKCKTQINFDICDIMV